MSALSAGLNWLKQSFAWSNSRASWQERLTLTLFLIGAAGLAIYSTSAPAWVTITLWAGYFLAMAVCTRQGWLKLFGPVLFYDMIRTARRSRYVIMRLLYATVLLSLLCFMYLSAASARRAFHNPEFTVLIMLGLFVLLGGMTTLTLLIMFLSSRRALMILGVLTLFTAALFMLGAFGLDMELAQHHQGQNQEAARLAETFFSVFMIVQLSLVVLLTPAYVAGAISEEKDRKTLEFMLATDLHNREIVLSKLLSRMSNMALFLLTGLPILSVLQFLGGVDTGLMLAGFLGTGLTMLGIASVSILFSTLFQKPRDSIGMAYLVLITYISIGTVSMAFEHEMFMYESVLWPSEDAPTLADGSLYLNAGNPLGAVIEVGMAIDGRPRQSSTLPMLAAPITLAGVLPDVMWRYTCFHVPLSLLCVGLSILRLRAIALKQSVGGTTKKLRWWDAYRPPVGEAPMLWKELHIEGRARVNFIAWIAGLLLVLLTVGSGLWVLGLALWNEFTHVRQDWHSMQEDMNIWFRVAGTGVASLTLLMVGVRASTSITNERERDTFDALIATPISAESILWSKLLGSLTGLRLGWLWFGSMMAIGIFSSGVHLLAVPIIITAWFIYALCFAMVGLWFSMSCKTSMRATVYTVLTSLFLGGGHWLFIGMCCFPVFAILRLDHPGAFPDYLLKFMMGLTPPVSIAVCSFSWENLHHDFRRGELGELVVFSLIGMFLWGIACVILWFGVLLPRFRLLARREELIYQ